MKKILYGIILFNLVWLKGFSQSDLMLQMLDNLPQANVTNPSIFNNCIFFYSLPTFTFNYENSAFTYNELISPKEDGTTNLNVENILSKLQKNNHASIRLNIDLFRFGFRYKKMFFTISAVEKLNAQFYYSKNLINLAWNGNTQFIGQTIDVAPQINANYYRELAIGISYIHNKKITFGIKPKLLFGLANVSTNQSSITLNTDTNIYELKIQTDVNINASGVENFSKDALSASFSSKNLGFATDLGVSFNPNNKWETQISLLNLGFINWKNDTKKFKTKGSFQFNGINLNNYFQSDTFSFNEITDSLRNSFNITESNSSFTSMLTPNIYGSVSYKLNKLLKVYFIYNQAIFKKSLPSFGLGAKYTAPKYFTISLMYSIKHTNYFNLGLASTFKLKSFQFFAASDNLVGSINWKNSQNVNFRFGINFLFSKKKN